MNILNKLVVFLAVFCMVCPSHAVSMRRSNSNPTGRMASMPSGISGVNTLRGGNTITASVSTTGTSSSASALLDNIDCIEAYTSCIKGPDICGTNLEECTTKVLFHGKMPMCLSTLMQCSSSGINSLFGTGTTTALNNAASTNKYGEVTDYTYPTDGSVLGQMIVGAAIQNRYDTSSCVKRYTSCLKKENVCGSDFELCTSDSEFRKQRVNCDSTLARCQSDGLIALFCAEGSSNCTASASMSPQANSRIGNMIVEGANLAATNAVSTCYKLSDQCILKACTRNPYMCTENVIMTVVNAANDVGSDNEEGGPRGSTTPGTGGDTYSETSNVIQRKQIYAHIKKECSTTIGGSKYCHMTFGENHSMPSASQLNDPDIQEEVFEEAYNSRMNASMKEKIQDLLNTFDTKAKRQCANTIKTCAMRTCGGGVGSVCYSLVNTKGTRPTIDSLLSGSSASLVGAGDGSINGSNTYDEIQNGCSAIVNTDFNCKYSALALGNDISQTGYTYSYIDNDAFTTLFPKSETSTDPIGVVAELNAALATNYSTAAVEAMRKNCENVAKSCIKAMCGSDYQNCFRNRNDVESTLADYGDDKLNKSMNKVGGVLDYNIVLGLCMNTVKDASACEEHLKIESAKINLGDKSSNAWGGQSSVLDGWLDAGKNTTKVEAVEGVVYQNENNKDMCTNDKGNRGECNTMDEDGDIYDEPIYVSVSEYKQTKAAQTLFSNLIYTLEAEAQAKYNAKITREQSMCLAENSGGIMGKSDTGSTYDWVKLKTRKVPKNYNVNGLKISDFQHSNDLYGSFCRVRVSVTSDDPKIMKLLQGETVTGYYGYGDRENDNSSVLLSAVRNRDSAEQISFKASDWTRYFAVGDSFTCGSWIPANELENLAKIVAGEKTKTQASRQRNLEAWLPWLGATATAVGGGVLGDSIAKGGILGGWTGQTSKNDVNDATDRCVKFAQNVISETSLDSARTAANQALKSARAIQKSGWLKSSDDDLSTAISNMETALADNKVLDTNKVGNALSDFKTTMDQLCDNNTDAAADAANADNADKHVAAQYNMYCADKKTKLTTSVLVDRFCDTGVSGILADTSGCANDGLSDDKGKLLCTMFKELDLYACVTYKSSARSEGKTESQALAGLSTAALELKTACENNSAQQSDKDKSTKRALTGGITAAATGVAGFFITREAVRDINKSNMDTAQTAAYEEFMSQVGNHIRCVIGGEEVAGYGESLTVTIE